MSLPYFFDPSVPEHVAKFSLNEEASKHAVQVLRMREGEHLHITDGKGYLHVASILQADKKQCIVCVEQSVYSQAPSRKVSIAISLLKNTTRFEWFLEKATEIGVNEIIPLLCDHTEHRHFRHDRMRNIVVSAMIQSQQTWLPVLHEPQQLNQLIQRNTTAQKLIAHCEAGDNKIHLSEVMFKNEVLLLIGPEGDFTPSEIALATQYHYKHISLGSTRLRAETAGITGAVICKADCNVQNEKH